MATLSDYMSGTISLANGSVTVTGTGTLFEVTRFREGDTLQIQNLTAVIASVDSDTQLTLTEPWTGTTIVDGPYRARQLGDGSRVSTQAATVIELLGNGVLMNLAELGVEEGKVPVGGPTGEYELADPATFGIQDPNGSLGKLAALTLGNRQILQTDENGVLGQSDITMFGKALLARNDAFGWGLENENNNIPNDNADTLRINGVYRTLPTTVGGPGTGTWQLLHMGQSQNYATQVAFSMTFGNNQGPRIRNLVNNVWTSWRPLSAEYDYNSNGGFVRFQDGTQICMSSDIAVPMGSNITSAIWTFPAQFSSIPWSVAIPNFTSADTGASAARSRYLLSARSKSNSAAGLNCQLIQGATAQSGNWEGNQVVSIGRWYN